MTLQIEITSPRLRLMALGRDELQTLLDSPSHLQEELNITLCEGLMEGRVKHAIGRKLAMMAGAQPVDHPWFTFWLILKDDSGEGVGLAGFKGLPDDQGVAEIGYGMATGQRGYGMMTEAVGRLAVWGFQTGRCHAVSATTDRSNRASQRVLEKNGFVLIHENDKEMKWLLAKGGQWSPS